MAYSTAEEAMFRTNTAEAREAVTVHNAQCDRQTMELFYPVAKAMLRTLFERKINLCDNGCAIDIEAIVEGFRPHDAKTVERAARELAAREEAERDV